MNQQRPYRYRPPGSTPPPPQQPRRQPRAGGSRRSWLLLGGVLLLLAAAWLAVQSLKPDGPAAPVQRRAGAEVQLPKPKQRPDSWSQTYNTTFVYAGQRLVVQGVTLRRLNSATPRITYLLTLYAKNGDGRWILDRRRWFLGRSDITARGQYWASEKPKVRQSGGTFTFQLTFRVPLTYQGVNTLNTGLALVMFVPGLREPLQLALEVPRSHDGIPDRSGLGGLT